jgi:hypothetical protein
VLLQLAGNETASQTPLWTDPNLLNVHRIEYFGASDDRPRRGAIAG